MSLPRDQGSEPHTGSPTRTYVWEGVLTMSGIENQFESEREMGDAALKSLCTDSPAPASPGSYGKGRAWCELSLETEVLAGAIVFLCCALLAPGWPGTGEYQICHSPLTWLTLLTSPHYSPEILPSPIHSSQTAPNLPNMVTCLNLQRNLFPQQSQA